MNERSFIEGKDYYLENGKVVLTEEYLARRNICCSGGCRHCPYEPRWTKGNRTLRNKPLNDD